MRSCKLDEELAELYDDVLAFNEQLLDSDSQNQAKSNLQEIWEAAPNLISTLERLKNVGPRLKNVGPGVDFGH